MKPFPYPRTIPAFAALLALLTAPANAAEPVPAFVARATAPAATAPALLDEKPAYGTVRNLSVVSVSLAVGSTEREEKRVVYSPPPGWYIRSHKVECEKKSGLSSFTVSTVPAGWAWSTDSKTVQAGHASAGAPVPVAGVVVPAKAEAESGKSAADHTATNSSHHAIVVDVTAKGAGFWRGGGAIDLTVTAEMVYLGK